jgi:hypothetical protein
MPKLAQRLNRLEQTVREVAHGARTCRLCYGSPVVAIHVMHEPDHPGFRKTGECYLAVEDGDRITDDLRCRECRAAAVQIHLMSIRGAHPAPEGRLVRPA